MRLLKPPATPPRRLGILPGSFNPPTRAHLALALAGLEHVDSVLLAVPSVFPHKTFAGASLEERLEMLLRVAAVEPRLGVGVSEGGLFLEMAREAREIYPEAELVFLCGRDAAERIVGWDYGEAGTIERMLEEFQLLVAPRNGDYVAPVHLSHAVRGLALAEYDACSATSVREAMVRGEPWRELVPGEIASLVERIYSPADASRNARKR